MEPSITNQDFLDHTKQDHLNFEQIKLHQNETDKKIDQNQKESNEKIDANHKEVMDLLRPMSELWKGPTWKLIGGAVGFVAILLGIIVAVVKLFKS